jgi:NAD(P)-dependent dehydrogenase (short-subunit alcohol dehydrogenase family)
MQKIALVTGASRGIGHEAVCQLAKAGFVVYAGYRTDVPDYGPYAASVRPVQLNMEHPEDFTRIFKQIDADFGHLDVLINNAGIQIENREWSSNTTLTLSMDVLRKTMEVNFFALVDLTRILLPLIEKSAAGRIVNVSSIMGSLSLHQNPEGLGDNKPFAYDVSKTAVNQFTIHLAHALKDTTIKVNAAHPGWVKTDMGTDRAPLSVEEGAATLIQLATLGADGVTGQYQHMGKDLPW